jgi:SAM-dependent methyltransferase
VNWKNAGENAFLGWFRMLFTGWLLSLAGLRYCLSWAFLRYELHRRLLYTLCSPWAISRRFLDQRGETGAQGYGETPLVTLAAVAVRLELSEGDALLELGSGTGRNCAWLSARFGCRAVGVEQIPQYVRFAEKLERRYFPDGVVQSRCGDMFALDMSGWRFVYVDCTAMSEAYIRQVAFLCAGLPNGARLVTVNAALHQLMPERFQVERVFPGLFLWGWSDIRIYQIGPPDSFCE